MEANSNAKGMGVVMEFSTVEKNGVIVASIEGQVRISTQNVFLDQMNHIFENFGSRSVILDMGKVSYMNSAGIGIIVDTFKKFRDSGGRMILCGLIPDILRLFEVTKLNRFIEIYANADEALHKLSMPGQA
jgi:anti-anti-sigma factor